MADIAKAYVQIIPSAEGIKGGITQALGGEAAHAGTMAGSTIGATIKKMIIAAGIGKAISDTIIGSLKAGGALQQSFGGLDTLYGDAADAAKQSAVEAARAGISANSFAEQAVSFGAALKSSTSSEQEAAEAANQAIMDMADNAAKMGTDIASIQNAYQGFAKGNYTMLDNLKLGYGGTRTEMERLLKDAEKASGVHYDIDNLADVYEAIHVIQGELNIAGSAADEATKTLTGSAGAVKAAWQNVLGAMAFGEIDLGPQLQVLSDTLSNFIGGNLLPMIGRVFQNAPAVIEGLMQMFTNGLNAVANNGEAIGTGIFNVMAKIGEAIVMNAPQLLLAMALAFTEVAHHLLVSIGAALDTASNELVAYLSQKIKEYGIPEMLQKGIDLIKEIANGLIQGVSDAVRNIQTVIDNIKQKFEEFDWGSVGGNIISGIAKGITSGVETIVSAAKDAAESAFKAAKDFLGIKSPSKLMEKEVGRQISAGMAVGITKNIRMIESAMQEASGATNLTGFGMNGDVSVARGYAGAAGFVQNVTINSPTELSPSEVARQTRNSTQQLALAMNGVY